MHSISTIISDETLVPLGNGNFRRSFLLLFLFLSGYLKFYICFNSGVVVFDGILTRSHTNMCCALVLLYTHYRK